MRGSRPPTPSAKNPDLGSGSRSVTLAFSRCQVVSSPQGAVGIRGFAVVHSSGTWHNHLVFSIVPVNPSSEEVEVETHPLSVRRI